MASLRAELDNEVVLSRHLASLESTVRTPNGRKIWYDEEGCLVVLGLLKNESKSEGIHEQCWKTIAASMKLSDEEREAGKTDFCDLGVEHGVIEAVAEEINKDPIRDNVINHALACFTGICLVPKYLDRVKSSGVIPLLISNAERFVPDLVAVYSLIALANLAIIPESRTALIELGVLELVQCLLPLLEAEDEAEMDCGLSAASIVCRLSGGDEDGPAVEMINADPKVPDTIAWILNEVLVAGPNKPVLGSFWNPANIVLDVKILSSSESIRPKLRQFVSLVTRALETRSKGNMRLIAFGMESLRNLAFDNGCLVLMLKEKSHILKVVRTAMSHYGSSTSSDVQSIASEFERLLSSNSMVSPDDEGIPPGHTKFTWFPPAIDDYIGLGHTSFSWQAQ